MNQPLSADTANSLLHHLLTSTDDLVRSLPECYQPLLQEAADTSDSDKAAHMTPGLAPYSLLGMQLAAFHQGNLLSNELYPHLHQAELTTLEWLTQRFALPYAQFSHGGSYNNLQALWQARDNQKASRRIVYASNACHYSVAKACQILGLELVTLPTDSQDRLLPEALVKACATEAPMAVVLNYGTTTTGSLDSLPELVGIAQKYNAWLHIDASWGGANLLLPENLDCLNWVAQADSFCFDPHKSLFQPRPCSVFLSRHPLSATQPTSYLSHAPFQRLSGSYGAELFLPLWLNLQILGETWFIDHTRKRLEQAGKFAHALETQTNWNIIHGETGIVCFNTERELSSLMKAGVFSEAVIVGKQYYRAVFADYRIEPDSLLRALHPFL